MTLISKISLLIKSSIPGNGWTLSNNEFYVKGADGKDLATYQGSELEDWYVWGNDLAGKIKKDKPYYYYKDHLGSIRAIVNEDAQIVAAYDGACPRMLLAGDAWGYPLEGRTFNADSMMFKYTGKELDKESLYDYFGARYYDARIANWGSIDPLLEKHYNFSPYNYTLRNPLRFVDPDGRQVDRMKNDPGINYPVSGPSIGFGLATVLKELLIYSFENPSTLLGLYRTVTVLHESLSESARLRFEEANSVYWTEEIVVTASMSENQKEANKQTKKLSPSKVKELEKQEGKSAEEFKEDYVGEKNVGKFDIYIDPKSKEIFIQRKPKYGNEQIRTGVKFD